MFVVENDGGDGGDVEVGGFHNGLEEGWGGGQGVPGVYDQFNDGYERSD